MVMVSDLYCADARHADVFLATLLCLRNRNPIRQVLKNLRSPPCGNFPLGGGGISGKFAQGRKNYAELKKLRIAQNLRRVNESNLSLLLENIVL